MTSDQFKKDYRQMKAQGVEFTPEDIVLLNALFCRYEQSRSAAVDVHLPRLAFLPRDSWWRAPLVLREPTIAHDLWAERAAEWIDVSDNRTFCFVWAFALSRHPGKLPDATRPKKVIKEVFTFAARRLCRFTHAQLHAAVEYALFGAEWTVGEKSEEVQRSGTQALGNSGTSNPSPTIGLLTDARMLRLPITLDDARRMTASELCEAITAAKRDAGCYDFDKVTNRLFGDYVRARNAIKARSANKKSRGAGIDDGAKPAEALPRQQGEEGNREPSEH